LPVALRGVQTFAGHTLAATQAGVPIPIAAKSAIMPTIAAAARSAAPTVSRLVTSLVPGLAEPPANTTAAGQRGSGVLFDGENGIPNTRRGHNQYKRAASEAGMHTPAAKKKACKSAPTVGGTRYNF
jgi:hypothetical protein